MSSHPDFARSKDELLRELNSELPPLDWRKGAQDYLAGYFEKHSRPQIEEFVFTKPLAPVTPEDPEGSLTEVVSYLFNFAGAVQLLKLPRGARVLDVACGGGWFSHWLRKLGYDAVGMDLSSDFIDLARKRLLRDPDLAITDSVAEDAYRVHDFEAAPLPDALKGSFDAIVLESCLHHFFDPVTALSHVVEGLKPDGVVLILEGENRTGAIRPEYMQVMLETATLERPYPRAQLIEIARLAGLGHLEFLGAVPGFYAESAPLAQSMTRFLADSTAGANICIGARRAEALQRVAPSYREPPPPRGPTGADHMAAGLRDRLPTWMKPAVRAAWRAVRPLLR